MVTTLGDITVSQNLGSSEAKECMARWGAAVLPGWLDENRLKGMRKDFNMLLDDKGDDVFSVPYERGKGASLNRSSAESKRFKHIQNDFNDPDIENFSKGCLGWPCYNCYEVYETYDFKGVGVIALTHFNDDMEGTLCAKCVRASNCTALPINERLYNESQVRPTCRSMSAAE